MLQAISSATAVPISPRYLTVAIKYWEWGATDPSVCTGTILDATHVLTAGHCACGDPESYEVIIGDTIDDTQHGIFVLNGAPILFDQRVCRNYRLYGNDLALLNLRTPFSCEVALIARGLAKKDESGTWLVNGSPAPADCRPFERQFQKGMTFGFPASPMIDLWPLLRKGSKLTAIGYGFTDKHVLGNVNWASIPIASADCSEPALRASCAPFAEMVLAYGPGSGRFSDTCGGDSGGPVFRIDGDNYTLVGVTSRAAPGIDVDPLLHCGGGGIYTLIGRRSVQDWLLANGVQPSKQLSAAEVRIAN
jgi:hypothetical protein